MALYFLNQVQGFGLLAIEAQPFGDVIYLTPPFVIEERDLSSLTRAIDEVLNGR